MGAWLESLEWVGHKSFAKAYKIHSVILYLMGGGDRENMPQQMVNPRNHSHGNTADTDISLERFPFSMVPAPGPSECLGLSKMVKVLARR